MIPTKTELVKVAAHMPLTDIVEHPLFRALQNRAEGFGRIVMDIAPGVLVPTVVDRFMGRVSFADALVALQLIGHQMRGLIYESGDPRARGRLEARKERLAAELEAAEAGRASGEHKA